MVASAGETPILDAGPSRWRAQALASLALDLRISLAPSWKVFTRLSLLSPLIRDTFTVERLDGSSEDVFTARHLAGSAAVGVSYEL